MTRRLATLTATLALLAAAPLAGASEYDSRLRAFAEREAAGWIADPVIVSAIRAQNRETGGLSEAEITALDAAWRGEIGAGSQPTIAGVLGKPASEFLRARLEEQGGLVTEVFVMDARGLNVASASTTSDYWQGDEAKWQETFLAGPGAVHIGEVELDESTQTYQSQVSLAIADPATGEAIGAVTVGINLEQLD